MVSRRNVGTDYVMNHYVQLAKSAVEEYVKNGKTMDVSDNLPSEFYEKNHGVFVSLHMGKELRGCIGTHSPAHKNLAEEIIMNAVAACSRDHRFIPISADELADLSVEVSLLGESEKISDMGELDPIKYGAIVKCSDGRCGLLLPALEGVDTAEQQILIACQKGGINPAMDKNMEIYKFSVEKYSQ